MNGFPGIRASLLLSCLLAAAALPAPGDMTPPAAGAEPAGLPRALAQSRARAFLDALIAINSTNSDDPASLDGRPSGNELQVALWFEARCVEAFGPDPERTEAQATLPDGTGWMHRTLRWRDGALETHVLEVAPGRANFIAVLSSPAPVARPVLVMGHMDVVGADPSAWNSPPFRATERDGYVFGRGAIDCKGPLAAEFTAFLALAQQVDALQRHVVFFATAAEEGGPNLGVDWVLEHAPHLLREPEFALNEGGRVRVLDGAVASVNIQTTEKVAYDVQVSASGPSGHGSVPLPDNALAALARAVQRVHAWRAPARLNDTTRQWLSLSAGLQSDPARAAAMTTAANAPLGSLEFAGAIEVLQDDPVVNAVLRAGASLTRLNGGFRDNVIPNSGSAVFNLRVLPDDDVLALVAAMQQAGGEPAVRFQLGRQVRQAPPPSPTDTALYQAMRDAAAVMAPDAVVLPFMSTGATDGAALRAVGIPTYGILPIPLLLEDELAMHGDNERAPVTGLGWAAEFIYRSLANVVLP